VSKIIVQKGIIKGQDLWELGSITFLPAGEDKIEKLKTFALLTRPLKIADFDTFPEELQKGVGTNELLVCLSHSVDMRGIRTKDQPARRQEALENLKAAITDGRLDAQVRGSQAQKIANIAFLVEQHNQWVKEDLAVFLTSSRFRDSLDHRNPAIETCKKQVTYVKYKLCRANEELRRARVSTCVKQAQEENWLEGTCEEMREEFDKLIRSDYAFKEPGLL